MTKIAKAAKLLQSAGRVCVLTGAGISAESGLSTFRDSDGLWNNHPVEEVATPEGFAANPAKVWHFYNELRTLAAKAEPNAAHNALARARKNEKTISVITQNVDGLHQRAGSADVIELHGTLWAARCTHCPGREENLPLTYSDEPLCQACGSLLRPDIVWFGEQLPENAVIKAEQAATTCDVFVSVGTSAQVYPAAGFAIMAARRGIPFIEVNLEPTPLSEMAAVSLFGKAGVVLPQLLNL